MSWKPVQNELPFQTPSENLSRLHIKDVHYKYRYCCTSTRMLMASNLDTVFGYDARLRFGEKSR